MKRPGTLIISLDFEMYWGMLDQVRLEPYRPTLLGTRQAVPAMLQLFEEFGVHATWATVGFLFFPTRRELLAACPAVKPAYAAAAFSPYAHLCQVGADEEEDPCHFAMSLVQLIRDTPHQEVGTHTFCHYYCLEEGQDLEAFRADLRAATDAAARVGVPLESLVFPRNQLAPPYVEVLREAGIRAYRGNQRCWFHHPRATRERSLHTRALRLADHYLPVSGRRSYPYAEAGTAPPFNLRASSFLRPYTRPLRLLEPLRQRRLRAELTAAARRGEIYHLWWHPENFGTYTEQNLALLRGLLTHFRRLRQRWGMQSLTMGELAERLERAHG